MSSNGSLLHLDAVDTYYGEINILQQVHEAGVAVLVVEQNANVSLSIADRGYVLQTGRIVLADEARKLLQDENLRKAYLGR